VDRIRTLERNTTVLSSLYTKTHTHVRMRMGRSKAATAAAAAAAVLLVSSGGDTTCVGLPVVAAAAAAAEAAPLGQSSSSSAAAAAAEQEDSFDGTGRMTHTRLDHFDALEDEEEGFFDDEDSEDYYFEGTVSEDWSEEEEGEITGTVPHPILIPRQPDNHDHGYDYDLQTLKEMRRQLRQVIDGDGAAADVHGERLLKMMQQGKFQFKKRAGGLLGDRKGDDTGTSETYNPDRYSGLKALQTKLQADVDAEIETLDQTKEALEAEYASLADEIAELEQEEQSKKKTTALLNEKKTAMHSISEKMADHEAAKLDCTHAMHVASSKKKVLKEIVGDCESIRTRMDHVKAEMETVEIELESFKKEDGADDRRNNDDDRKLRTTQDVADRIKALQVKQQALLDEEAKLRHDAETLQADRARIHQSVLDRASSLITDLMEQDETIKRALETCLRTKHDAEKALQAAEDERTIVCDKVKVTGKAMIAAEEDVLKVDDFLKTVGGGGMGRKLRGAPEL